MMIVRMVFTCIVLLVLSCNGQKKTTMNHNTKLGENHLSLIVSDYYAPADSAAILVIRDEKSLLKFYAQINKTRKPGLPVPKIDFSDEMIVVRCIGEQKNGGMPELFFMEETPRAIVIGVKEKQPINLGTAITGAFSVYKMPFSKKEIIVRSK
ncbi:hypothetical protein [Pareuzebyella sediminis]|uniref:hypothetical protein n=1 Tax=Pareuzebyella sediminis TaxID=2607998 RepID=UPI0011ECB6BE|nr:hypothetical protein [Pareuzebyella sediminis]